MRVLDKICPTQKKSAAKPTMAYGEQPDTIWLAASALEDYDPCYRLCYNGWALHAI